MKHILHTSALMGLVMMLAGAVVVACQKDNPETDVNPKVTDIAAAPFTLSAVESRNAFETFEWTVDKTGNTDSVSEELDEMTVTVFNTFTFTVKPDSGSGTFPGVNLSSSNTKVVKVNAVSKETFTLSYVGDGEATITVWNGSQGGQTSTAFKVVSRRIVHPTAFRFVVDGKNVDVKCWDTYDEAKAHKQCILSLPEEEAAYPYDELTTIHKVVFKGFVPENCSYDMIAMDNSIGMSEDWYNWLIKKGYNGNEMLTKLIVRELFADNEPSGRERYYDGGPIASLKGKIAYNAVSWDALTFSINEGWSNFRTYVKNTIYTKYFVCSIDVPESAFENLDYPN